MNDMRTFFLQLIRKELHDQALLLYSLLMAYGIPKDSVNMEKERLPSNVIAASILLKQRCRYLTSVQLMLSILVEHCGLVPVK